MHSWQRFWDVQTHAKRTPFWTRLMICQNDRFIIYIWEAAYTVNVGDWLCSKVLTGIWPFINVSRVTEPFSTPRAYGCVANVFWQWVHPSTLRPFLVTLTQSTFRLLKEHVPIYTAINSALKNDIFDSLSWIVFQLHSHKTFIFRLIYACFVDPENLYLFA